MEVLYEDNHLIIVSKEPGEIVQGDKTGDEPLVDTVRRYLKEKYAKPGNVFCGVCHRLDRPVAGIVVFAKTSKALARMNELFRLRDGGVEKTYWAIVAGTPPKEQDRLVAHMVQAQTGNKSYITSPATPGAKEAALSYTVLARGDRFSLLEVRLETGRKHQIRVQLASIGCPVKGDLKYGARRSNPDGGISLLARRIRFTHPVSGKSIDVTAPLPADPLWATLAALIPESSSPSTSPSSPEA